MTNESDEAFDQRIVFIAIMSAYAIFLALAAFEIIQFSEFIDFSENRRSVGKLIVLPLFYAIFISVMKIAEFISERFEWLNFSLSLITSIALAIASAYIGDLIISPQYDDIYKDLYMFSTFMICSTAPYFMLMIGEAFHGARNTSG